MNAVVVALISLAGPRKNVCLQNDIYPHAIQAGSAQGVLDHPKLMKDTYPAKEWSLSTLGSA